MADRTKLFSFIIFKLKNIIKCNFSLKVIVRVNSTGWINENEIFY